MPKKKIFRRAAPIAKEEEKNMASDGAAPPLHDGPPFEPFHASLSGYLTSSRFSDLVVRTADGDLNVHKMVVFGHSEGLSRLLDGGWGETQDSTPYLNLNHENANVVKAMIRFMYDFKYTSTDYSRLPILFNGKVYELAKKYDIIALKAYAANEFKVAVQDAWKSGEFPGAIGEIYLDVPTAVSDLGECLVDIPSKQIKILLQNEDFKDTLNTVPGFAALLVAHLVEKDISATYRCPGCDHTWKMDRLEQFVQYDCPNCLGSRSDWSSYMVQEE